MTYKQNNKLYGFCFSCYCHIVLIPLSLDEIIKVNVFNLYPYHYKLHVYYNLPLSPTPLHQAHSQILVVTELLSSIFSCLVTQK